MRFSFCSRNPPFVPPINFLSIFAPRMGQSFFLSSLFEGLALRFWLHYVKAANLATGAETAQVRRGGCLCYWGRANRL